MNDTAIVMPLLTAALYTVFLNNLLFSGGLGATEMIRAAQRNSEVLLTSLFISGFSTATAVICRLLTTEILSRSEIAKEFFHWRFSLYTMRYPWMALIYGAVLLGLYLLSCLAISLLPLKLHKTLLLKRMGMSVLNSMVMSVPLLMFRLGSDMPRSIGMALGAGIAFYIVTMMVNSGMYILHANKAIPPMFTGVPSVLIYTGLLALAFTGFTGEILFQ